MRNQIVIPARLSSTRLPEKLLRRAGGKSVLRHTYESASRSTRCESVVVAVDDIRLAEEVASFGGQSIMTSPSCPSGTDRIAEAAARIPEADVFVNVQGDEPEIDPASIDLVTQCLIDHPDASMATVATPIDDPRLLDDPSVVKIVIASATREGGRAIYFSRGTLPTSRDRPSDELLTAEPPVYWQHIGLYAYRREFLEWFAARPPSRLEMVERLEQLRAIEAGKIIQVARVESAAPGIDTQADFDRFSARFDS